MRLLVSVRSASEASAAIAGGADLVDAKDPSAGALGAVSRERLIDIRNAVGGVCPMTAALGDAANESSIEDAAHSFAVTGAQLVKIGFAGIRDEGRVLALTHAATRGANTGGRGRCGVVAVAYADSDVADSIPADRLLHVAALAGAAGLLIDTADKNGPGLRWLIRPGALTAWAAEAHRAGLFVALAGQLTWNDLPFVRDAGADIAGVRGAACDGGRNGHVSSDRVRHLRALCHGEAQTDTAAVSTGR